MAVKPVTVYQTSDGEKFETRDQAEMHERESEFRKWLADHAPHGVDLYKFIAWLKNDETRTHIKNYYGFLEPRQIVGK